MRSILIIEENKNTLKQLKMIVAQVGFDVIESVTSEQKALDLIRERASPFFFILSDLCMDGVSTFDFIKTVRTIEGYQTVNYVLVTDSRKVSDVKKAISLGIAAYILKPINPTQIKQKMISILEQSV